MADLTDNEKKAREYSSMGRANFLDKDWDKAIENFTEAIKLAPDWPNFHSGRGDAYCEKGEYDKAIADLSEAIRIDDIDNRLKDISSIDQEDRSFWAMVYNSRGIAYTEKKNYKQGTADFEAALLLNPNEEMYRNNIAVSTKASMSLFARFWAAYRRRITIGAVIGVVLAIIGIASSDPFASGIITGILGVIIMFVMGVVIGGVAGFILPVIWGLLWRIINFFRDLGR